MKRSWTFAIDCGGTFTDVVARSSDGQLRVEKLLSENPGQYGDAALEAIRRVLAENGGNVAEVRMGTTVATNALLERKGERVALAITRGFGDALTLALEQRIGRNRRPHPDLGDLAALLAEHAPDRFERGIFILAGVLGQQLLDPRPAVRRARDNVGERPAAVDGEGPAALHELVPLGLFS